MPRRQQHDPRVPHLASASAATTTMAPHQPQPPAELISNALAKIRKLAGTKKHGKLAQQCQGLIDHIHEVRVVRLVARGAGCRRLVRRARCAREGGSS